MIRPDLADLHHRFRAKSTAEPLCEWANPIRGYRKPYTAKTKLMFAIAAALVAAAFVMGVIA
jgi:hypothetical protein